MRVIGKDRTGCDACNPLDEIIARIEQLERRVVTIVARVQGIPPDGTGNVTLPTSDSVDGPLYGNVGAFAMSSEVKEATEDVHQYASAIADDVIEIQTDLRALSDRVGELEPQGLDALTAAVQSLQNTVAMLETGKVNKSGDTMTGNLFIEASSNRFVYIKRTDLDRDVEQVFPTSGTSTVGGFIVVDKDGGAIGGMNRAVSPSEVSVTLQNSQTVNGALRHCNLSLKIAKDGSMYATVPTPSDKADNSTKIATTGWVNSASSVVHTTGNETMAGTKVFTSSPKIQNNWLWFSNGTITTGGIYSAYLSDKTMGSTYMRTYNSKGQNTSIAVQLTDDGVGTGYAPTTPSNATSNEIATADWVISKINQAMTQNGLTGL